MFTIFRRFSLPVLLPFLMISKVFAGDITGKVIDKNGHPISGVNITLQRTTFGAASNIEGVFNIMSVPDGDYEITASFIGFRTQQKSISIKTDIPVNIDFSLEVDPLSLEELTVKAERVRFNITVDEPVRKEIFNAQDIKCNSADGGLLSAMDGQTGLNTRPCALCGSAGIGMQGLDASYTEITVDGMPIISGVGALYGLDGVSVNSISGIELTKGSGSAENGSNAIAGSVDLITTNPNSENKLNTNISGSNTLRHTFSVGLNSRYLGAPTSINIDYASEPDRLDYNNDQLTDSPLFRRMNLGLTNTAVLGKSSLKTRIRYYNEYRFAGDVDWTTEDQGSALVYGRSIDTERSELAVSWTDNSLPWGELVLESAAVIHSQDSWYGATEFDALQQRSYTRLSFAKKWSDQHNSLAQSFFTYEDYDDNLNLGATTDRLDRIPGAMIQHTYSAGDLWVTEGGIRIEHFGDYGTEPNFRGSVLFKPTSRWRFRMTSGTGFRPVTIYSLDKAVHAGFDNVVVPDALKPERSWNTSASASFIEASVNRSLQLDLNLFYTRFSEKAVLAYGHMPGTTVYSNADDAYSQGIELKAILSLPSSFIITGSGTITKAQYKDETGWHHEEMQNVFTSQFTIAKTWLRQNITVNLSTNLFGPQYLPANRSRDKSPVLAIANFGITKTLGSFIVSLYIKNITDWSQGDNPFMEDPNGEGNIIDSAMIYGPLIGRTVSLGVSYSVNLHK